MTLNSSGNYSVSTYMSYVFPYMRIAELYLSYAEADFEYDGTLSDYGYECLNKIRLALRPSDVPGVVEQGRRHPLGPEAARHHPPRAFDRVPDGGTPFPRHPPLEDRRRVPAPHPEGLEHRGRHAEKFYKLVDMKENDTRIFTTPKHYWLAIPNSQLNINGQLVQNPGY